MVLFRYVTFHIVFYSDFRKSHHRPGPVSHPCLAKLGCVPDPIPRNRSFGTSKGPFSGSLKGSIGFYKVSIGYYKGSRRVVL